MRLAPDAHIAPADIERGKRALIQDSAWASLAGALYGGVILVGFMLELGASASVIGLLAAIPLIAQAAQLPGIALVERLRRRRAITVTSVTLARVAIVGLALVPLVGNRDAQIALVIAAQIAITVLGAVGGCSLNSWLHQFLPRHGMGAFLAQRLVAGTVLGGIGALGAGLLVDHWRYGPVLYAYSTVFALAGLAGFVSSWMLARVPEPPMAAPEPHESIVRRVAAPFRDQTFRPLIALMAAWNVASNFAAPFLAVFLMKQLGLSLGTVTSLAIASQVSNALTLYAWGRVSDRLSNKAVLAVAMPTYFACFFGLTFVAVPEPHAATLPLLYAVHVVMGAAAGGVGLATGNLGLKLAPQGRGTAYLAAVSLSGAAAGGVAPIVGGVAADWFEARELSLRIEWVSPGANVDFTVLQFEHWAFVFAIAAALGLYVLHRLSRIREDGEVSERAVIQEFGLEALRTIDQLSSIAGLRISTVLPFGWLIAERERAPPADPDPQRRADE